MVELVMENPSQNTPFFKNISKIIARKKKKKEAT